jgi:hypothetical protein
MSKNANHDEHGDDGIEALQGTVNRIRFDVVELEAAAEDLPAAEQLHRAISDAAAARREAAELRALVTRLASRVQWLEDRARASTPVADFDAVDQDTTQLARVAEHGAIVAGVLMSDADRGRREAVIAELAAAMAQHKACSKQVADAAGVLRLLPPGQPGHATAAAAHDAQVRRLQELDTAIRRLADPAEQARTELAADDERRATMAAPIEAGREAWVTLTARLRARIEEETTRGALLPAWFVAALGPAPNPKHRAKWLNTATLVLAYRITYKVTDPASALGPEPTSTNSIPRRRTLYSDIMRNLRVVAS